MPNWVAFLDLIGTRQRALLPPERLADALGLFLNQVSALANELGDSSQCYVLSDSAVFNVEDLSALLRGLQKIRSTMFANTYYFKCAIVTGELQVNRVGRGGRIRRIEGFSFSSRAAAEVYEDHQNFHGIGIYISRKQEPRVPADIAPLLVESNFVALGGGRASTTHLEPYKDVRYTADEIGAPVSASQDPDHSEDGENGSEGLGPERRLQGQSYIDLALQEAFKARLLSPRAASSYVSLLIGIVSSSDFSRLNFDDNTGRWVDFPLIFRSIHIKDGLRRCGDVPGIAAVYLSILSRILSSRQDPPRWIDQVIRKFLGQKVVEAGMRTYGHQLLDAAQRDFVLSRWAELATSTNQRR